MHHCGSYADVPMPSCASLIAAVAVVVVVVVVVTTQMCCWWLMLTSNNATGETALSYCCCGSQKILLEFTAVVHSVYLVHRFLHSSMYIFRSSIAPAVYSYICSQRRTNFAAEGAVLGPPLRDLSENAPFVWCLRPSWLLGRIISYIYGHRY